MSGFIRSAADGVMPTMLRSDDRRGSDNVQPGNGPRGSQPNNFEEGMLWSGPKFVQSGQGIPQQDAAATAGRWLPLSESAGSAARKKLTGTTRDAAGAPLGAVAVQALQSAGTAAADGTTTSDAQGYYEVPVANPTGTYKVDMYKAGSPDVAGTSVNNLVPV